MSLPDLSRLYRGAAPTAPPAGAYIGTVGLTQWLQATNEGLRSITSPDNAPEGTQPKPQYAPLVGNWFNHDKIGHIIKYLVDNFDYVDKYRNANKRANSGKKVEQIMEFLNNTPPFNCVLWLTLNGAQKNYSDRYFPLYDGFQC